MTQRQFNWTATNSLFSRPGLDLQFLDWQPEKECRTVYKPCNETFYFGFCLEGSWKTSPAPRGEHVIKPHSMGVSHIQDYQCVSHFQGGMRFRGLNLSASKDSLRVVLGDEVFTRFIEAVSKPDQGYILKLGAMPPSVKHIAASIFRLRQCNGLEALQREAMTIELLHAALTDCLALSTHETKLSTTDINKLELVRETILQKLEEPLTITSLASLCGLNEYKLKRSFKAYFGLPVYAFIKKNRLYEAKRMIEKDGLNVTEAAVNVGYSSFGHFSQAFQENFGCLPSELVWRKTGCQAV